MTPHIHKHTHHHPSARVAHSQNVQIRRKYYSYRSKVKNKTPSRNLINEREYANRNKPTKQQKYILIFIDNRLKIVNRTICSQTVNNRTNVSVQSVIVTFRFISH